MNNHRKEYLKVKIHNTKEIINRSRADLNELANDYEEILAGEILAEQGLSVNDRFSPTLNFFNYIQEKEKEAIPKVADDNPTAQEGVNQAVWIEVNPIAGDQRVNDRPFPEDLHNHPEYYIKIMFGGMYDDYTKVDIYYALMREGYPRYLYTYYNIPLELLNEMRDVYNATHNR